MNPNTRAALFFAIAAAFVACDDSGDEDAPDAAPRAFDGQVSDGQAPDGQVSDGEAPDGQVADGQAPDGRVTDGQVPDGQATDGQVADGQAPDAGLPPGECDDRVAVGRPLYGDLHVHTSFSFDSYGVGNTRNDPAAAYRFAKGEEVGLPPFDDDGGSARHLQLSRPLDFAAVTDHSEFIGESTICTDAESRGYNSAACMNFRNFTDFEEEVLGGDVSFVGWGLAVTSDEPERIDLCNRPGVDCSAATRDAWSHLQDLTNAAYEPCTFTAFNAYEWTGTVGGAMNHRNVIFRSEVVPTAPISYFEVQNWHDLALGLRAQCNSLDNGCDSMAIPHNPNQSAGSVFLPRDRDGAVFTAATARLRQEMEPLVEMVQTKQDSECRNGFTRFAGAEDELCNFEKVDPRSRYCEVDETPCGMDETPEKNDCALCLRECGPDEVAGGCIAARDYVRNALKLGLTEAERIGVNPFQLGVTGGTDTHNGTPGAVEEPKFAGHHGATDNEDDEHLAVPAEGGFLSLAVDANPGGLAAVWAVENTRASIFDAMRRRETFATSGTQIAVRFFGGWGYPDDLCEQHDFAAQGYAGGVPMGGILSDPPADAAPRFAVMATRDPGTEALPSNPLQRAQIIKIWVDDAGEAQERVFEITPELDTSATVDTATCRPAGPGVDQLCTVWTDPDFDASQRAAYYTRVVETPACRWHQYKCNADPVDCGAEPEHGCCDARIPKAIQERAWTSSIWYEPRR